MEPEQRLQRHPEAGSSWPSWPKASHHEQVRALALAVYYEMGGAHAALNQVAAKHMALLVRPTPSSSSSLLSLEGP